MWASDLISQQITKNKKTLNRLRAEILQIYIFFWRIPHSCLQISSIQFIIAKTIQLFWRWTICVAGLHRLAWLLNAMRQSEHIRRFFFAFFFTSLTDRFTNRMDCVSFFHHCSWDYHSIRKRLYRLFGYFPSLCVYVSFMCVIFVFSSAATRNAKVHLARHAALWSHRQKDCTATKRMELKTSIGGVMCENKHIFFLCSLLPHIWMRNAMCETKGIPCENEQ